MRGPAQGLLASQQGDRVLKVQAHPGQESVPSVDSAGQWEGHVQLTAMNLC